MQGDSGHSQVSMVTNVYSHILDEDRKKNAELFEEAFYQKKETDPVFADNTIQADPSGNPVMKIPDGVDPVLLLKDAVLFYQEA